MSDDKATNIQKLRDKLRELFQLDRGDLDFGLYRVMSLKRAEVNEFLDKHLLPQVEEALGTIANADKGRLQKELNDLTELAHKLRIRPDENERIQELQNQINDDKRLEADTYNHLYNFFSRYYDEGDFMALRRYKGVGKEAYAIPYNGEEVKLHWANSDQYYIKTTENYASYVFIPDGDKKKRVRFEIQEADNEKDVVKEINGNARLFMLAPGKDSIVAKKNQLVIRFDHRPLTSAEKSKYPKQKKQEAINEETHKRVLEKLTAEWRALLSQPIPTQNDEQRTLLGKHLNTYTAKNSFDYFIHKDLGGFLRRELYAYLKSEVIHIDNLEITDDPIVFKRNLAQLKAIKSVGNKIIDFLAQLEDFQKQLYLKKKFVLETQYCVTLDKVPLSLYADIIKNKAQHKEWVDLFAIDELKGDMATTAYSKPLKPAFLDENPHLVLDTRHFNEKFKDELLAALSEAGSIDEQSNGLIVHGDNFQALNLMQARYKGQVQCIYIDPPYNSPSSRILYKNNYLHSSWLSLICDRVTASNLFLDKTVGSMAIAIDDNEQYRLSALLNDIFISDYDINMISVCHNPKGIQGGFVSVSGEYAILISPQGHQGNTKAIPKKEWKYDNFRNWGGESERHTSKNCFYPILVKNNQIVDFGEVCSEDEHPQPNVRLGSGIIAVYPVDKNGIERKWTYSRKSVEDIRHLLRVKKLKNGQVDIEKAINRQRYKTIWQDTRYIAGDYGTKILNQILGGEQKFDFPKSIHTVEDTLDLASTDTANILDYFAGSGTTGHAVINLNRKDSGNRKYILVEIGHHFEDVLLPRMKKVVYSATWKDGKPKDMRNRDGVSQLFRYVRLESYEDTLDSLVVHSKTDLVSQMQEPQFIEDYHLRYALGAETAESASLLGKDFIDPFSYTLSVVRDGIRRDVRVDLAETFNFLLGLRLATRRRIGDVLAITGTMPKGENCLILWRDLNKTSNAKLEKWFKKNRNHFGDNLNLIYVNGDHTLNAIRESSDQWEASTTEITFKELMFSQN